MTKLQGFVKAAIALSFRDKAMMKYLLNHMVKLPKDAFVDDGSEVYTFRVTQSQLALMDAVEQDAAEWFANSSNATNSSADLDSED